MPEAIIKYSDLIKDDGGFEKLEKDFDKLSKIIQDKAKEMKGKLTVVDVKDTSEVLRLQNELDKLKKSYEELSKTKKQSNNIKKETTQLSQKEKIALEEEREAVRKSNNEARAIAKLKQTQAGSIEQLRAKLAVVTIEWAKLSEEERENSDRGERLVRVKREVTEQLKALEKKTGDARREVGNYKEQVKEAIRELEKEGYELKNNIHLLKSQQSALSKGSAEWLQYEKHIASAEKRLSEVNTELGQGNSKGFSFGNIEMPSFSGGLGGVSEGIGSILGSIGPVGLAIGGVVAGVTGLGMAVLEVEKRFSDLRREASQFTSIKSEIDDMAVNTASIVDTFGADQSEVMQATNTLMKEFGITADEAYQIIQSGYLSSANANGEMIDSIREYSSQVRDAGGNAEDLISILDASGKQGIFSDKGVDVVKEFGLRIREQTTATKDALSNAFGSKFTNELLKGVREGSITSIQALEMVSQKMNDTTIPADKLQTVIADVFGGPGEDAGIKYLQSLTDISKSTQELVDLSNPLTRGQQEQLKLNNQLSEAQNKLSKQFEGTGQSLTNLGIKIKTGFYNVLAEGVEYFQEVGSSIGNIWDGMWSGNSQQAMAGTKRMLDTIIPSFGGMTDKLFELTEAERMAVAEARIMSQTSEIASGIIENEIFDINNKISALEDENLTQEEKNELLQELIDKYPQYSSYLVDEQGNLKNLETARKEMNRAIIESAMARAKEAVFMELVNEKIKAEMSLVDARRKQQEKIRNKDYVGMAWDYIAGSDVDEANQKILDANASIKQFGQTDFKSIEKDLKALFGSMDLDFSQKSLKQQIDAIEGDLTSLYGKYEKALNKKNYAEAKNIRGQIDASKATLEQLRIRYRQELGIDGADDGKKGGTGISGSPSGIGSNISRRKADELDLIEEIRQKKAELLEDDLLRELENNNIKIDADKKRFAELQKKQDEFLKTGLISPEEYKRRSDEITEISALAEQEREKRNKEIRDKFAEQERQKKISDLQELNKLEASELEKKLLQQGIEMIHIEEELGNLVEQNLREEINLRLLLTPYNDMTIKQKQELIDLELELLRISRQKAQEESDLIRATEDVLVQGQIDDVNRRIEQQQEVIDKAQGKANASELAKLKALMDERYQLRKRAIEDEFEYQLSKVEEGSLEEQKIRAEYDNALKQLEYDKKREDEKALQDSLDRQKNMWKEFADGVREVLDQMLDKFVENQQKKVDKAQESLDKQEEAVDVQRQRAEEGLSNTLAFEEKERAKREKELQDQQKRLERREKIKGLYASYTGYAQSGEKNPVLKTIRDFGILRAIEATFGEGGIPEDVLAKKLPSNGVFYGASHKSKSGGIPIMVEGGEGIFSVREMMNLGKENFYTIKNLAKQGKFEQNFFSKQRTQFVTALPVGGDNSMLIEEVKSLRNAISDLETRQWGFDKGADGFIELIEKVHQQGRTTVNRHKTRF